MPSRRFKKIAPSFSADPVTENLHRDGPQWVDPSNAFAHHDLIQQSICGFFLCGQIEKGLPFNLGIRRPCTLH